MRYSVYDYTRRRYDYYDAPGPPGTHAGSPPVRPPLSGAGMAPESASWKLPSGAHKIGSGEMPQGRIASVGSMGDISGGGDVTTLATYAMIAYLAWRLIR